MPVFIIGTYNADGTPNAMNAAWGGIGEFGSGLIRGENGLGRYSLSGLDHGLSGSDLSSGLCSGRLGSDLGKPVVPYLRDYRFLKHFTFPISLFFYFYTLIRLAASPRICYNGTVI